MTNEEQNNLEINKENLEIATSSVAEVSSEFLNLTPQTFTAEQIERWHELLEHALNHIEEVYQRLNAQLDVKPKEPTTRPLEDPNNRRIEDF